ncbi:MAG: DUF4301 family protein [Tidjanibacter sp.]|nr:DUF4301 family protein [Tidjanibacter sp.]
MFTEQDLKQIAAHGLSLCEVEQQIDNFRKGFPYLNIKSSATVGNGICAIDEAAAEELRAEYRAVANGLKVEKFVPTSGAATRMFKDLFAYVNDGEMNSVVEKVGANLDKFAFAEELAKIVPEGASLPEIISAIIGEGLEYGAKPKGLVLFHRYQTGAARTAFEEHLVEGAMYAACNGVVNIHFTVSPEHMEGFRSLFESVKEYYEGRYDVRYNISMSVQKSSTDTIAVNPDCTPFRNDKGELLFRPAGHGALIENLNDIDADIIFIKTIDNVAPDARKGDTIKYKEILAGILVTTQKKIFDYAAALEAGTADVEEVVAFVENDLCVRLPEGVKSGEEAQLKEVLAGLLDRPLRVCGMVRNEGEPGGGPFWAEGADGVVSLQIAESSQISPEQKHLMAEATHFNPVDIVCGTKNRKGEKYDFKKYVDPATGFISSKSSAGRTLLAQELPGLWNGAMASWNTLFVEVPITTFSPIKVVTDLLRPEHQ